MGDGPILTVFTPTYNRAALLPRLYQCLLGQTSLAGRGPAGGGFVWLVVDDGSTDRSAEATSRRSSSVAPTASRSTGRTQNDS